MTRAASSTPPRTVPAGRDLTLDLTRVACVLLVVFVHILFTGVGRDADGGLVIERTVEQLPIFDLGTWVANIMPLFFVVGGYAARAGWRSAERRGESADRFVRVRLARLARPAVPVMVFFTVALSAVRLLGIDPQLVDTIAIGVGSPLWFLAAYLIAQACAPFMIRAHARWGLRVPAVLLLGAFAVDAFRFLVVDGVFGLERVPPTGYGIGQEIFGIPNVIFVWLFAQQIGFFLFDGWFARRQWWQTALVIVAGYALLWMLVSGVGYPSSMLANQWPPSSRSWCSPRRSSGSLCTGSTWPSRRRRCSGPWRRSGSPGLHGAAKDERQTNRRRSVAVDTTKAPGEPGAFACCVTPAGFEPALPP